MSRSASRGRRLQVLLLACGLLLLLVCWSGCSDEGASEGGAGSGDEPIGLDCTLREGKVVWVRDGDTVNLQVRCTDDAVCGPKSKCVEGLCSPDVGVRFMAINTGEIPHGFGEGEAHECMGDDAHQAVRRLALDRRAELVFEPVSGCITTEGSERMLAYIWVDGILLQERLLEEGLACLYWYKNEDQKEQTLYYERLSKAQERAQRLSLGLWSPERAACGDLDFPSARCR